MAYKTEVAALAAPVQIAADDLNHFVRRLSGGAAYIKKLGTES